MPFTYSVLLFTSTELLFNVVLIIASIQKFYGFITCFIFHINRVFDNRGFNFKFLWLDYMFDIYFTSIKFWSICSQFYGSIICFIFHINRVFGQCILNSGNICLQQIETTANPLCQSFRLIPNKMSISEENKNYNTVYM